jgi:hypothetical protein
LILGHGNEGQPNTVERVHQVACNTSKDAEVNFELVEWLAEREERDWTYFGRLCHDREKKFRDPQDVLIEVDRLRQQLKKRRTQRRGTQQQ